LFPVAKILKARKVTPIPIEFVGMFWWPQFKFCDIVDIAGLVEGASDGLGLGNKFLEHIKRVSSILHTVFLASIRFICLLLIS
jgi:ribosome-binding ATPase YchF (GTP1/OBG family)